MSSLECDEKAVQMREKAADIWVAKYNVSAKFSPIYRKYNEMASEFEKQAADLRRRGY